ncbi:MAG: preprotein translocase subunit Sec61beta [Aigarchaeota archaeon]|nr:preprotein translocase subunit Sec61beta [Aigarchaeota archaeon]MDW8092508.1 preprotein translocase subunit Sec61beta [Nitrososphaerota archaeon]
MSKRRPRREAPLPATAAGLLRFFEEEGKGIKIRPEAVVGIGIAMIVMVLLLRLIAPI